MSKRPVTLWKPEEAEQPSQPDGYHLCASAMCANIVGRPGALCTEHQAKHDLDRSPRNVQLF